MRSFERSGVLVDQCTGCGGLYLDKGELEQLSAAENAWHQTDGQPSHAHQQHQQGYGQSLPDDTPHRTKRSFLSELFDD
jgi:Zn-finger nucleic acid-binding protein